MDPRRLENEDEEKFWEAWIKDELTFCYRFGKIGSPGGTKLKKFKTAAEAQAELEEKLSQKLEEGFVEIGAEEEEEEEEPEAEEAEEDDADDEAEGDDEADDEAEGDDEADDEAKSDDEADDDEAEGDDEAESDEDEEEDDDEDEDDEDDGPASEPPPPPPPPPRPTLPQRFKGRVHAPTAQELDVAKQSLLALSQSLGGRSWRVRHRARAASRALSRLGGLDPHAAPALATQFSALMADVIAPKKRLPLEAALSLLWEVDAAVAHKVVTGWRAKMLASPAAAAIGVLGSTFDVVPDADVALHTGAALVERHLPLEGWKLRFAKVVPFLEESLATKGSTVAKFLSALKADDALVKGRIAVAGKVKGSVKLEPLVAAPADVPAKAGAAKAGPAKKGAKR